MEMKDDVMMFDSCDDALKKQFEIENQALENGTEFYCSQEFSRILNKRMIYILRDENKPLGKRLYLRKSGIFK